MVSTISKQCTMKIDQLLTKKEDKNDCTQPTSFH